MDAFISLPTIANGIHYVAHGRGRIMALRAYFDDTGTAPDDPLVGWAGYVGDEEQWDYAEQIWQAELRKRGLQHFHMTVCESGDGPYGSRAERDALTHDLRQAILKAQLFGAAVIASKKDWNDLVPVSLLPTLGTAEQNCINICIWKAQNHSHQIDKGQPIALFFDSGGDQSHVVSACAEFNRLYQRNDPYAFAAMKLTPAIQMADMLAWELRQVSRVFFETGEVPPPRPHFESLVNNKWMDVFAINREAITNIVAEAVKGTPAVMPPSLDWERSS